MPTQHIYFNDRNYDLLKKEKNMSELINNLLTEHYSKNASTETEIINHVKEIWAEKEQKIKNDETRREMIIRKYKEHHDGIEPTEAEIEENMKFIEKVKSNNNIIQE